VSNIDQTPLSAARSVASGAAQRSIPQEVVVTRKLKRLSPTLIVACIGFLVAHGPAVHAANTVFSTDIVDGEVKTEDLGDSAVTRSKLAPRSVTSANLLGANLKGTLISLPAGEVANGRCRDFNLDAPQAVAGDVAILSLMAAAPQGMIFSAVRAAANRVVYKVCNLTGGPSPAIADLPIHVVTIR
jgi:hypothetical protein